jgi:hypothetical protein
MIDSQQTANNTKDFKPPPVVHPRAAAKLAELAARGLIPKQEPRVPKNKKK